MDPRATVADVWKLESARIVAALTRLVRDVGLAEDLAQDALLAALEEWPAKGVPANPGGWLMLTAKHRAIDRLRRDDRLRGNLAELGRAAEQHQQHQAGTDFDAVLGDGADIGDDVLRLIFIACHPVLSREASVALTLRMIGGLTTAEIARAFLVPEPTIGQRISRAKRTLGDAEDPVRGAAAGRACGPSGRRTRNGLSDLQRGVRRDGGRRLDAPGRDRRGDPARPDAGRAGAGRTRGARPGRADGAARVPDGGAARPRRRAGAAAGTGPRPLGPGPDPQRFRGAAAGRQRSDGPYVLQAAIAASHARARTAGDTDWVRIAGLYELLVRRTPTPVVELNRAVAVSMAFGPERGLAIVDQLADPLRDYHLLPAVRGDLLRRLGRDAEARAEFARAADLARNAKERDVLLARAAM